MEELRPQCEGRQKGIRILAPIVGIRRKKDEEAQKDIIKQNEPVLLGFRNAYVFDVSQTDGVDLSEMREVSGDAGENLERLAAFVQSKGIQLVYSPNIAPALGMSYGGRIAILPGQSKAETFATLVHETAHELLHKAERRTATTKTVRETEAEAVAFVVGKAVGLVTGSASADSSSFTTATHRCWPRAWKLSSRPPASFLQRWNQPSRKRLNRPPPMNSRRWRHEHHSHDPQESRRLETQPPPQNPQPALHGTCHRGDG